ERRRGPGRGAPRGHQGGQPGGDPALRAGGVRRAGLRGGERPRHRPPRGPGGRHVLQLLPRQGVGVPRHRRGDGGGGRRARRRGPRARADAPGVRRGRVPRVLLLHRRRPCALLLHAPQRGRDPPHVRRRDAARGHRDADGRPARGDGPRGPPARRPRVHRARDDRRRPRARLAARRARAARRRGGDALRVRALPGRPARPERELQVL
ncbi:MAG: Transcriptional regulator, AcrR family, partial [uncultured Solirubrobacteraceae bacterium]